MKTAEEALKEGWAWTNPVDAFRDGYNAAIEAMRAESEPVAWMDKNKLAIVYASAKKAAPKTYAAFNRPLSLQPLQPLQPLRELSRDEVPELWHQATQEEGGIGKVVERFAKLVREVK